MPSSIINSDNGVISGTSGLKSTGGDDGVTAFQQNGTERMRIDSSGNVLIGTTTTPSLSGVAIGTSATGKNLTMFSSSNGNNGLIRFIDSNGSNAMEFAAGTTSLSIYGYGSRDMLFWTSGTERMRITNDGYVSFGKTGVENTENGLWIASQNTGNNFQSFFTTTRADGGASPIFINRQSSDGTLIEFRQANTAEGTISVSGSTVSYNGGHLSRWAQMLTKPDLLKGTVMSNLDEMNVYVKPTLYWTEDDELPVDEEGNPTVAVGDVKQETSVSDNEQLNKVKVSDVEGDPNVAGVFVNWTYDEAHQVDEINMAMTGDMIIRIAQGVTVARGDLLMSAGDGTAKPQGDDIVRSKTIAKVTSTHVTCTYDDGSYCVPCVLMAC
jgi:hypothetical protein